jgi:hypothetical protein
MLGRKDLLVDIELGFQLLIRASKVGISAGKAICATQNISPGVKSVVEQGRRLQTPLADNSCRMGIWGADSPLKEMACWKRTFFLISVRGLMLRVHCLAHISGTR